MAFTKDIGINDFYKLYVKLSEKKGKPYKTYKEYTKILKLANSKLRDKIIYNAESATLPYRLGELFVHKFENTYSETNRKAWKIDFKATKEQGRIVYFGHSHGYKWKWAKRDCRVIGKRYYKFKPCRTASRMIADAVLNKQLDFYK